MFIPYKKPTHDPQESLAIAKQNLKMLSIGMGEYTLDSIFMMPISPKSYGRPIGKMKSQESTMIVFDTFVPSSIPLEAKKEDHVSVEPLSCGGSLPSSTSSNTHTSPKASESFTNSSSNKDPKDFHVVPYSYPQGLPLKETQANLHLAENTFDNAKLKSLSFHVL